MSRNLFLSLAIIAASILALIVYAVTQPSEFRIERTIEINAPAASVFPLVSDLKRTAEWSPWVRRDPKMTLEYGQVTSGLGAWSAWKSETEGEGKQTIVEITEGKLVKIRIEFFKPWEGVAQADINLVESAAAHTKVIWGMDGTNRNFMEKLFFALMDFDTLLGADYEEGLKALKELSEKGNAS